MHKMCAYVTAAALTAFMGCSSNQYSKPANAASDSAQQTALIVAVRSCSSACGEPGAYVAGFGFVPCAQPLGDVPAGFVPSGLLVERCDYRVSDGACEEDEVCALAEIREVGSFRG